jgi:hypothetical protein
MIHRLGNLLLILALLAATGGHWALLQSLAWTSMLTDHLQTQSFTEAMSQTFDSRHPCKYCLAIAAAKRAEKKSELPPQVRQKIEFPPLTEGVAMFAPATFQLLTVADTFAGTAPFQPPTPPPRSLPV